MEPVVFMATLNDLPRIEAYVRKRLPEGFDALADQVALALEEIFANICHYAYEDRPGRVETHCRPVNFDGRLHFQIRLRDWGPPFDPFLGAPPPDLSSPLADRRVGGLGLHLVRQLTAHYCYVREQSANTVELYFAGPADDEPRRPAWGERI